MNSQVIKESERVHYFMQLASYFSELIDLPGISFAYTKFVSDTWYNQAYNINLSKPNKFKELLTSSESLFSSRDRETCFYLTPETYPNDFGKMLEDSGYAIFDEESWMFYSNSLDLKIQNANILIKEVDEDLLPVFGDVYRKTLPGPEVDGYVTCVFNGFISKPPLVDIKYYLAYIDNIPIGMLSLLCMGKFAGLYAVAVDENYQRMGACRALVSTAIEYCKRANIEHLFLQTGHDTDSEAAFTHMGFKTEFVRLGYAAQTIIDNMQHG